MSTLRRSLALGALLAAGVPAVGRAAAVQEIVDDPASSWAQVCPAHVHSARSADEHRLDEVTPGRIFRIPDRRLKESVALLERQPFVPLSPDLATHLLLGKNANLDSRLAADARGARARAKQREQEARDPFFKGQAGWMSAEARSWRSVAAEALRLRGGRTAPYLVRALVLNEGTGGFSVHVDGDELLVVHASLGRQMVPPKRRPLVIYLEKPPKQLCLGVSMAE